MIEFTLWDIFRNLLLAIRWTILLSLIAFIGGSILGLILQVLRQTKSTLVQKLIGLYIQLFQGTPLLMQLFLAYFGLALFGVETTPLGTASACLILYTSAYLTDIWHGCVKAIPKGQWEASSSLALSFYEQLRYVILPQAVRISIAPTVGFLVQVIKGTALSSIIGFTDLTKAGQVISNATFQPTLVYACVGLLYFALCFPVSFISRRLERKLKSQH